MKKIVGILAAAAVAASAFAADVSAKVKLDGSLFDFDGTKDKAAISGLSIKHNTDESWNPVISMSTSSDNAGASVSFYVGAWDATKMGGWNHGYGIGAKEWNIWMKPVDVFKLSFGRISASVNTETIDYSNRLFNYDEWGYQAEYAANGLTLNLGLHTGNPGDNWLSQSINETTKAEETNIAGLGVYGAYAADFGSICFLFDANNTFKDIKVGAGYKNTFGEVGFFADAALFYTKDRESVKRAALKVKDEIGFAVDADVKYNKDAFGVEAYARFKMDRLNSDDKVCAKKHDWEDGSKPTHYDYNNPMQVMLLAKATYKLDPVTVYGYFKSENLLGKRWGKSTTDMLEGTSAFISTIKIGVNGNVGAASWDVCGQIDTGAFKEDWNKVKFSVPVSFSVAF